VAYSDFVIQDRRLTILRLLDNSDGYQANEFLLNSGLQSLGHNISADSMRNECAWLAEQSLVTTEQVQGIMIITLSERGSDVAHGRAVVPGVKRPRPGR